MNNKFIAAAAAAVVAGMMVPGAAFARDEIKVAGSSTVLPYAKIVAEEFQKANPKFKAVVESGGSGAGIKLFCAGVGADKIDVANSSRKMKDTEIEECKKNGVNDIIEVKFGYDGIVFASDIKGPKIALEPKDMFLALAPEVVVDGKLVANPNKTWKDVNASLPAWDIVTYIPGEKHGTREVFEEKVLAVGCKAVGADKLLNEKFKDDKKAAEKSCLRVRKDNGGKHAVDIDGDYTETLARLNNNKESVGVFGLAFYENNTDKLQVASVSGITPDAAKVADGTYPVSRPLFFYVKKAHIGTIPGLKEYVQFFTSEKMIGEDGPLVQYGLVALPKAEFDGLQKVVSDEKTMAAK